MLILFSIIKLVYFMSICQAFQHKSTLIAAQIKNKYLLLVPIFSKDLRNNKVHVSF